MLEKSRSSFSIIVPVFNESNNLEPLIKELTNSLKNIDNNYNFEIIIVNDGSNDNSISILNNLKKKYPIFILSNKENLGQSYSLMVGAEKSKYDNIITLDGDLQNDPNDINDLINLYNAKNKNYKLVGGIRTKRKDSFIKILSSKIANKVRKFILKDKCDDTGCSLKIFDKKIFLNLPYFNGLHRFLPALFSGLGYETQYTPVNHRHRISGISKYGVYNRLFRGIRDIIKVKIILYNYKSKND